MTEWRLQGGRLRKRPRPADGQHNHGEGEKRIMSVSQGFPVTFDMRSQKRSRKKAGNI
jgi:hypothetical protein